MDRKDQKKLVRENPHSPAIVEVDIYTHMPIDNNYGYTMGAMTILIDKKTGLARVIPDDIANLVLQYLFWECMVCTGPVVIQNTVCSQVCLLGNTLSDEPESDVDGI